MDTLGAKIPTRGAPPMKKLLAGPAIAGVLLLGTATGADAQVTPAQEETANEDDNSKVGLFGLIGLAGLAGLAGLKRNDRDNRYDNRSSQNR